MSDAGGAGLRQRRGKKVRDEDAGRDAGADEVVAAVGSVGGDGLAEDHEGGADVPAAAARRGRAASAWHGGVDDLGLGNADGEGEGGSGEDAATEATGGVEAGGIGSTDGEGDGEGGATDADRDAAVTADEVEGSPFAVARAWCATRAIPAAHQFATETVPHYAGVAGQYAWNGLAAGGAATATVARAIRMRLCPPPAILVDDDEGAAEGGGGSSDTVVAGGRGEAGGDESDADSGPTTFASTEEFFAHKAWKVLVGTLKARGINAEEIGAKIVEPDGDEEFPTINIFVNTDIPQRALSELITNIMNDNNIADGAIVIYHVVPSADLPEGLDFVPEVADAVAGADDAAAAGAGHRRGRSGTVGDEWDDVAGAAIAAAGDTVHEEDGEDESDDEDAADVEAYVRAEPRVLTLDRALRDADYGVDVEFATDEAGNIISVIVSDESADIVAIQEMVAGILAENDADEGSVIVNVMADLEGEDAVSADDAEEEGDVLGAAGPRVRARAAREEDSDSEEGGELPVERKQKSLDAGSNKARSTEEGAGDDDPAITEALRLADQAARAEFGDGNGREARDALVSQLSIRTPREEDAEAGEGAGESDGTADATPDLAEAAAITVTGEGGGAEDGLEEGGADDVNATQVTVTDHGEIGVAGDLGVGGVGSAFVSGGSAL